MRRGASRLVALVVAGLVVTAGPAQAVLGTPVPPIAPPVDPVVDEVERCVDVVVDSAADGALVDRVTGELCNRPPVADAGADDEAALIGTAVALDGRGSSDPDGDTLTFEWTLTPPAGSTAALDDPTSPAPGFVPDRHGTYVATLTVHDGRTASAADEVRITTVNRAPVANAGPDVSVRADDPATLDGTASSDPDGDPLTYAWSLVGAPGGSAAAIDDASSAATTLVPDALGDYTVELTVSDGTLAATDTAVVTATHAVAISLSPAVLHTTTFESSALRLDLDRPAPPGGRVVALASDDADVASVPASVVVPAGESSAAVPVTTAATGGTAAITATSDRAASGQAVVDVDLRSLSITLEDGLVGIGRTIDGAVVLGRAAPAGGVVVSLSSSDPSRVSVAPGEVAVAEGATTAPFTITGVREGSVVLRATAPGHADAEATTAGTDAVVSIGAVAAMSPGESRGLPISLTRPAPPGGVSVTLTSSDPSVASVPGSVTIAQGQVLPAANPQITGHRVGTATVTARTQGYAPDDRAVTVRLVLTLTPNPRRVIVDRTSSMTIGLSGPAPAGGTTVELVAADPARVAVPGTVTVLAGQTTASFAVTGLSVGTTSVTASTAGATDVSATVHVDPTPVINAPNAAVGIDLQVPQWINLTANPDEPTTITVTVADPAVALLSTSRTGEGAASVSFPNVTNTSSRQLYVQGIGLGATTYTVSAPGNQSATRSIDVTRAGVGFFSGAAFTTTTFSGNQSLDVRTIRLSSTNAYAGEQEPRSGRSVSVAITSSNTDVGTITVSPLTFTAGTGLGWHGITHFDPASAGTATIALTQPAGFTAPSNIPTSVNATVTAPAISANNAFVGIDLQVPSNIALSQTPPSPVDLTITVADPATAVVSTSRTTAGGESVTFTGVGNTSGRTVYFQGLALGSTTYTVSAPGYATSTHTLEVTRSGVGFFSGASFTTTTFSANRALDVRTIRLSATNTYAGEQEPRPGRPVGVDVTSSNTDVGTITVSPLTFTAGTGLGWHGITHFDPADAGTATIAITQPAGFTTPSNIPSTVAATVTAPAINANNAFVGIDLQVPSNIALSQSPPEPVDLTVTVADPTTAVVSTSRTTAGASSVTFTGVGNTGGRTVYFQGLALGTTTYTVSAPGFATSTHTLEVTRAGVAFFSGASFTTTTFSGNRSLDVRTIRLSATNTYAGEQEPRPGRPVDVDISSDNSSVGTITVSPLTFTAGTGLGWHGITHFDPATVGTATIAITQPAGFTTPSNIPSTVAATVRAPLINLGSAAVGRDLQQSLFVTLEVAPPEPVDVTVTISSTAIGLVSRGRTAAGTSTVTFPNVTTTSVGTLYVQGVAFGTTAMLAQAAGYADESSPVTVTPAGVGIFSGSFSIAAGAATRDVDVRTIRLNNGAYAGEQEPRPGVTVTVDVTSSNTAVGTITNAPLTFTNGVGLGWHRLATFDPQSAGQTTIAVTQPPGFTAPSNLPTAITATVT